MPEAAGSPPRTRILAANSAAPSSHRRAAVSKYRFQTRILDSLSAGDETTHSVPRRFEQIIQRIDDSLIIHSSSPVISMLRHSPPRLDRCGVKDAAPAASGFERQMSGGLPAAVVFEFRGGLELLLGRVDHRHPLAFGRFVVGRNGIRLNRNIALTRPKIRRLTCPML